VVGHKGKLVVHILTGSQAGIELHCDMSWTGEIWNPVSGPGEDRMTEAAFSDCERTPARCGDHPPVLALGLPWHSVLFRDPPEEGNDDIEGVQLELSCAPGESSVVQGQLIGHPTRTNSHLRGLLKSSDGSVEAEVETSIKIKHRGDHKIKIGP